MTDENELDDTKSFTTHLDNFYQKDSSVKGRVHFKLDQITREQVENLDCEQTKATFLQFEDENLIEIFSKKKSDAEYTRTTLAQLKRDRERDGISVKIAEHLRKLVKVPKKSFFVRKKVRETKLFRSQNLS